MPHIDSAKDMVKHLIEINHKENDINYNGFMVNHSVHGVCTLYSLGASKERIEEYFRYFATRFVPLRNSELKINEDNWEDHIGDEGTYADYLPFFDEQVKKYGVKACFDKFVPKLLRGFIGGLFHPLIHIGFGLEYDFPNVFAEGLAFAACKYYKMGEIIDTLKDDGAPSVHPLDIIQEMKKINFTLPKLRKGNFPCHEIMVNHSSDLTYLASKWKVNCKTHAEALDKLAELSYATIAVAFGAKPTRREAIDFFFMHSTTCLQGLRVTLPYLSIQDQNRVLKVIFVGLLSNMWCQGLPEIDVQRIKNWGGPKDNIASWESIIEKAIMVDDEHVAKTIRTLIVIRDSIPNSVISHELLQRAAQMTTDLTKQFEDWELEGVGYAVTLPLASKAPSNKHAKEY